MEITVNSPKSDRSVVINPECPDGLDAKIAAWSPEVVNSLAERMFATDIGNRCRVMLNEMNEDNTPKRSEEEIFEFVASYVPGVKRTAGPKKVTAAQAEASLTSMTPEELKRLLEAAKAKLAEAEAA